MTRKVAKLTISIDKVSRREKRNRRMILRLHYEECCVWKTIVEGEKFLEVMEVQLAPTLVHAVMPQADEKF